MWLAFVLAGAIGTGAIAHVLTPTKHRCSVVLDVRHWGFHCFGPDRNVYSALEQKELQWVRQAACETARSSAFRRMVSNELSDSGVCRREARAISRAFRVDSIEGSRMIHISVATSDRALSQRVVELVMVKLVSRHGKVVIDPIQVAAAPTGQKSFAPALVAAAVFLMIRAARSTGLLPRWKRVRTTCH